MNLVKWGGSLITDKAAAKPTPQRERIAALAAAIAASDAPAVLVHGAGSFGHPLAKRFGLAQGSDGSCSVSSSPFSFTGKFLRSPCEPSRQPSAPELSLSPSLSSSPVDDSLAKEPSPQQNKELRFS